MRKENSQKDLLPQKYSQRKIFNKSNLFPSQTFLQKEKNRELKFQVKIVESKLFKLKQNSFFKTIQY